MLKSNIGIRNRFDIVLSDAKTGKVKMEGRAENIILDNMWTYIIGRTTSYMYHFDYILFGRGSGTPTPNRTSLFDRIAGIKASDVELGTIGNNIRYRTRSITLSPSQYVGETITEVGIGDSASTPRTHAMITDSEGNPLSITKTSLDVLTIYATIYAELSVSTGQYIIDLSAMDYLLGDRSLPTGVGISSELGYRSYSKTASITASSPNSRRQELAVRFDYNQGNGIDIVGLITHGIAMDLSKMGLYDTYRVEDEEIGVGDGGDTYYIERNNILTQTVSSNHNISSIDVDSVGFLTRDGFSLNGKIRYSWYKPIGNNLIVGYSSVSNTGNPGDASVFRVISTPPYLEEVYTVSSVGGGFGGNEDVLFYRSSGVGDQKTISRYVDGSIEHNYLDIGHDYYSIYQLGNHHIAVYLNNGSVKVYNISSGDLVLIDTLTGGSPINVDYNIPRYRYMVSSRSGDVIFVLNEDGDISIYRRDGDNIVLTNTLTISNSISNSSQTLTCSDSGDKLRVYGYVYIFDTSSPPDEWNLLDSSQIAATSSLDSSPGFFYGDFYIQGKSGSSGRRSLDIYRVRPGDITPVYNNGEDMGYYAVYFVERLGGFDDLFIIQTIRDDYGPYIKRVVPTRYKVTFNTPPPINEPVRVSYDVPYFPKTEDYVIDIEYTIQYNEGVDL